MKRRLRRILIVVPVIVAVLAVLTVVEQRRLAASVVVASPSAPASASGSDAGERLDSAQMLDDVRTLASERFEGRLTGTPGGARARALIAERFRAMGLIAPQAFHGYLQPFTFTHTSVKALWRQDRPFRKDFAGANVVGIIPPRGADGPSASAPASAPAFGAPGAGRYLLLSAHYDHLGVRSGSLYPGADDNASGVAALLAIAAYLHQHPLSRGVIVAAFDGEEEGLRGASAFVAHAPVPLDTIDVAVNMDMISRSATSDITIAGLAHWPALEPIVTRAAAASTAAASVHVHRGHDRPFWRAGLVEDWTHASDHGPFHDAGVPFLYIGVEDHDDYHRPTDTADRIDRRFYAATADLVLQLLEEIDREPSTVSFRSRGPS